jgi:hypothetical protein
LITFVRMLHIYTKCHCRRVKHDNCLVSRLPRQFNKVISVQICRISSFTHKKNVTENELLVTSYGLDPRLSCAMELFPHKLSNTSTSAFVTGKSLLNPFLLKPFLAARYQKHSVSSPQAQGRNRKCCRTH